MKKKALTILLAVTLTVAFMPSLAFAANTGTTTQIVRAMPYKYTISNVGSTLEQVRQAVLTQLENSYDENIGKESHYCSAVWSEISDTYSTTKAKIEAAETIDDLGTIVGSSLATKAYISDAMDILTGLGELTTQKVTSSSDLNDLKATLRSDLKKGEASYSEEDYNAFYWQKYLDKDAELTDEINDIHTFAKYILAKNDIDEYFPLPDSSDSSVIDLTNLLTSLLGSSDTDFDTSWIYSEAKIEMYKEMSIANLDEFTTTTLKALGYSGNKNAEINKIKASFESGLADIPDIQGIDTAYADTITQIVKATGVSMDYKKATNASKIKLLNKLEDIYYEYKESNYSEDSWQEIDDIYETAAEFVSSSDMAVQINDSVATAMRTAINKVPTYSVELASAKADAVAQLKTYKHKKKYNHKKVVAVISRGVVAINKCTTLDDVDSTYYKYVAKVKATIKKFKIKTSKVGKGTISKSKKVKYGSKYTVKIQAKAGYRIYAVYVDGKYSKLKNSYKFKNVKKPHTVKVIFAY